MPIQLHATTPLSTRGSIELKRLEKQLNPEWLKRHLVPVITQTSEVSIRLMDWLVTNYSKQHKVLYTYSKDTIQRIFDLHMEYKMTLDSYGRPLFDPFRRGARITFNIGDEPYTTTLGQMLFWYWAETHQVIHYCAKHAAEIEMHMTVTHHNRDKTKRENKKRKRTALSKAPPIGCFIFPVATRINFHDNVAKKKNKLLPEGGQKEQECTDNQETRDAIHEKVQDVEGLCQASALVQDAHEHVPGKQGK